MVPPLSNHPPTTNEIVTKMTTKAKTKTLANPVMTVVIGAARPKSQKLADVAEQIFAARQLTGDNATDLALLVGAIQEAKETVRKTGTAHNIIRTANGRLWVLQSPAFGQEILIGTVRPEDVS